MFDNRIVTSIRGCRETARPPVVSVGEPEKAGQGAVNGPVSPSESRRIPAVFPTFSPWPGGVVRDPPRAPNRFLPPRAAASADGHRDDGGVPGIARHLTACGKSHAAFERRCIPPEPRLCEALCVALPSKYTRYSSLARLVRRAPRHSRRSRDFPHRLLSGDASRCSHGFRKPHEGSGTGQESWPSSRSRIRFSPRSRSRAVAMRRIP